MSAKKDQFCWKCHENNTEIECYKCEVSYHRKCIANQRQICVKWVCNDCNAKTCDSINDISINDLNQLLFFSYQSVHMSADYYFSSDDCVESDSRIVRQMSLKLIQEKCHANEYKSTNLFVKDVKWILHNTIVRNIDNQMALNAEILVKKARNEIIELEECPHCYGNFYTLDHKGVNNFFSVPCLTPHTLVWAHVRGHPYWPAKAMKTNSHNNSIFVRFFGTYEKGWVKEKYCYLMSEQYFFTENNKLIKAEVREKLKESITEINHYIGCLNQKFPGLFQYANKKTLFKIDKMSLKLIPNDVMKSTNYVDSASNHLDFSSSNDANSSDIKSNDSDEEELDYIREYKKPTNKRPKKMKNLETETDSKNVIHYSNSQKEIDNFKKRVKHLEEQIEVNNKLHEQNIIEIKRNSERVLQKAVDEEKAKHAQHFDETKNKYQTEILQVIQKHKSELLSLKQKYEEQIKDTKTRIWCSNCSSSASMHCCVNTFYCSYECQSAHWSKHCRLCTKISDSNEEFSDEDLEFNSNSSCDNDSKILLSNK